MTIMKNKNDSGTKNIRKSENSVASSDNNHH